MEKELGRNTIVLLGAGHTNAHVLRMWKMRPIEDAQLVCVSNHPIATYSGMMPGVLAGQYAVPEMEIDLVRYCASAGVRLVVGNVTGIDREQRELQFADRPPLAYEYLSVGIGSRPTTNGVEIKDDSKLVAIKPMQTFLERLRDRMQMFASSPTKPRIAIVGGGIGSIEIAFCLDRQIRDDPTSLGLSSGQQAEITLVTGGQRVGSGLIDSTQDKVKAAFDSYSIKQQTGSRVKTVDGQELHLADGTSHEFDLVIWATSAIAPELLSAFDLDVDDRGFLKTRSTLQTVSDDYIFAVGDSGTLVDFDLPKAGVYAVRQGPILWDNLQRSIWKRKLIDYRPQQKFLKLINTADGKTIAEHGQRSFYGRWWWYLKNRIDQKFMRMYQDYTPMAMAPPAPKTGEDEMRCLGCGGKIGSQLLSSILDELEVPDHPDVIIGLDQPDDAAIVRTQDNQVTVTTDFFASPLKDPYLSGRIAVLNSVSDCFVMGAQPTGALAMVQLPLGHPRAQRQVMRELMAGAVEELNRAGAVIVGGHSIEGPRLIAGFTVLGNQLSDPKTKGMLKPGDQLVLTKPIGSGVLLAALMQGKLQAKDHQPMMESMLKSNQVALKLMDKFGILAMTDVTGFGLAGHAAEMLKASKCSATIRMDDVPRLQGCQELIEAGIQSTLAPENRIAAAKVQLQLNDIDAPRYASLFDPQTCGGLLFGIDPATVQEALEFLTDEGFENSAVIGEVNERQDEPTLVVV